MNPIAEVIAEVVFRGFFASLLERMMHHSRTMLHGFERIFPSSLRFHKRRLRERIKAMPFIYRDLESGDLLNDFVDLDYKDVTSETQPAQQAPLFFLSPDNRVKRSSKVLIVGEPGIGKTTFVRRVLLSIIGAAPPMSLFYEEQNLVPFLVPLKAIDNSSPHPILRYLESTEGLLARNGRHRLMTLAEERRLFLILDGYDELPFPEATNYAYSELHALFTGNLHLLKDTKREYLSLYRALAGSRIWLTSRPAF